MRRIRIELTVGSKNPVIKLIRRVTCIGLMEAKELVEGMENDGMLFVDDLWAGVIYGALCHRIGIDIERLEMSRPHKMVTVDIVGSPDQLLGIRKCTFGCHTVE